MEPGWVPEWEPGWELEWEPDWEAGWEPDWEPGWKPEWGQNWDQTGTKLAPNEGPLEAPWGSLGVSLELTGRTHGGPQGSPAPVRHRGPKKCQKCVTVVTNRPRDKRTGTERYRILGPPRGLSKRPY